MKHRKNAIFHFVQSSAGGNKITMQHAGEDVLELTDFDTEAKIENFYVQNKMPLVGVLDGNSFQHYMENESMGLLWCLFPMQAGGMQQVLTEQGPFMGTIAKAVKGRVSVTYTNTEEFKEALKGM